MVIKQSNPTAEPELVMEIVTDPVELAKAKAQREKFDRNFEWFKQRSRDIYEQNRGKYICIAGEELFVGDSALEVDALAKAAYPEDDGRFVEYIPREKRWRV